MDNKRRERVILHRKPTSPGRPDPGFPNTQPDRHHPDRSPPNSPPQIDTNPDPYDNPSPDSPPTIDPTEPWPRR